MIHIAQCKSSYELEPRNAPFGFKGKSVKEPSWQRIVQLESSNGKRGIGLSNQSILWSDAEVFTRWGEVSGNGIMCLMTDFALQEAKKIPFNTPMELLEQLLPITYEYGKKISLMPQLRMTFALNALVAVDTAAWLVYSRENSINNFDDMIPDEAKFALSCRHEQVAGIPLISYNLSKSQIEKTVDEGYFFLKVKIGSDPDKDGDLDKMLEWDKRRLSEIHEIVKDKKTSYTENGQIPYYLDANGRYDSKDRLLRLLDHADRIGALERIIVLEEPFPEENRMDVRDIPVHLASDESVHSLEDVNERIDMGYGAIALKPIAKTMSMSFKMCQAAHARGIPCFCADLTVNPTMVDLNKNFASRLKPLPGMKIGVLESNGHQNYRNWIKMQTYNPCHGSLWTICNNGLFTLNDDFYLTSGGFFDESEHYKSLLE